MSIAPYIEWAGMVAFAIDGAAEARRRSLDAVGVSASALATAVGGGTLRDLLLGRQPVGWLADPWQPGVILVIALGMSVLPAARAEWLARRSILTVLDAFGLGMATAVGAGAALRAGLPAPSVVVLAVLAGVSGGVLRDVMVNQVPRIFQASSPFYAVCAAVGATAFVVLGPGPLALLVCVGLVVVLRVLAVHRGWHLST